VLADEWKQAVGPWPWAFPKDHGAHPEFRTEWWYFTGNLSDSLGKRFGYQLTFFRQGIALKPTDPTNPWSLRDLYLAHFALTDRTADQFWYVERLSRQGPGLAGARKDGMDVWLLSWSAEMQGQGIRIEARHQNMEISLNLIPQKPLIFHGNNGLSRKGPDKGQASYYVSYTNLETQGLIRTPLSQTAVNVQGISWFDHEFGSNQLAPDQVGWNWFSLHLSDGHDLMVYMMHRIDGSVDRASSGTLISPSGKARGLALSEISVEVLERWKSPRSGGRYPNRWRIRVPSAKVEVVIAPIVSAQELITEGSTGVTYWEGSVEGKGQSAGREVTCEGYVELTGYAGNLGGLF